MSTRSDVGPWPRSRRAGSTPPPARSPAPPLHAATASTRIVYVDVHVPRALHVHDLRARSRRPRHFTPLPSATILPSKIRIARGQRAAISGSWVTIGSCRSRWSCSNSARMSSLVAESRLPVGSSHSSSYGSLTSARAIATRCRCPPDRWYGLCLHARRRARRGRAPWLARAALAARRAAVDERQRDVLERASRGAAAGSLEHEADRRLRARELVVDMPWTSSPASR